jgi:hypothetical protein
MNVQARFSKSVNHFGVLWGLLPLTGIPLNM